MDALVRVISLEHKIISLEQRIAELESEVHTYASRDYVQTYIDTYLKDLIPAQDNYSENSKLVGYKPLNIDRILQHLSRAFVYYNAIDWRNILMAYDNAAKTGNIDPYIVVAQMLKETDWGRSWWAMRPRRNPAGLGVTGETTMEIPKNLKEWALRNDGSYVRGYSFPSWEVSAMAHIGHLLGYIYQEEALTSAQRSLTDVDPRRDAILTRGDVKTLQDLDKKWNTTEGYGKSIAAIANAIKQ